MENLPPLSERLRPKKLSEVVGQSHLIGEGKPIKRMVQTGNLFSMVLWGPPGTGKTTLAKLIASETGSELYQLNAISSGVKEIRDAIKTARENRFFNKKLVLFIDEIHRFNKAQQDALLEAVEKGEIILIGATTENPSFCINSPLLSRMRVYQLYPLSEDELNGLIDRALTKDIILKNKKIKYVDKETIIRFSGGDARVLLNALETAVNLIKSDNIVIDKKTIETVFQKPHLIYDKNGDLHYDLISAFIKSIRGSDPDAAVYYLARMLEGGEDPVFIARRLVILASEDIGNAEPYALTLATSCLTAVQNIGMPEARIILSQVSTYLASCPKSNATYIAIQKASEDVKRYPDLPVPLSLRNPSTRLTEELGYGKGYKYSHDYPNNFVQQNFLPEILKNKVYYNPTENGREVKIKERLKKLWKGIKKYL
ncbi:Recombination protein MgsA [Persephonella hydrogeniphila]|uniref:Replication-associated recombination protein A n=1 Tax=Persephonella hydrogeniphila TaxID=198703 RepID=A0A285N5A4_9AQUI|nr:replication-associated recombination protein A [Persephonella hydrogeniphila]SNZ04027.1 Recombination protein MgsA [Persephonella hydrogeniphila]